MASFEVEYATALQLVLKVFEPLRNADPGDMELKKRFIKTSEDMMHDQRPAVRLATFEFLHEAFRGCVKSDA